MRVTSVPQGLCASMIDENKVPSCCWVAACALCGIYMLRCCCCESCGAILQHLSRCIQALTVTDCCHCQ